VIAAGRTAAAAGLLGLLSVVAGCGPRMDFGSNVSWVSLFESGNFDEWTNVGGNASAYPGPGDTITVSTAYAHHGLHAAELAITAGPDGTQQNTGLRLINNLPTEGYYSAWYYLPQTITVGTFWLLFKFRLRTDAADPASDDEYFDIGLVNAADGSLTLSIYDHRSGMNVPIVTPAPVVPVSVWFQIEAYYRNAQDDTGRLTVWMDGREVADLNGRPMAPTPYVEWDVVNVGENLTPPTAVVVIDDCAISFSRVGPTGVISE
jgi:hypothetical protein